MKIKQLGKNDIEDLLLNEVQSFNLCYILGHFYITLAYFFKRIFYPFSVNFTKKGHFNPIKVKNIISISTFTLRKNGVT